MLFWSGYTIHRGRQPAHLPQRLSMTGALMIYRPDEPQTEVDERFRWKWPPTCALRCRRRPSFTTTAGAPCKRPRRYLKRRWAVRRRVLVVGNHIRARG